VIGGVVVEVVAGIVVVDVVVVCGASVVVVVSGVERATVVSVVDVELEVEATCCVVPGAVEPEVAAV
jgi:hypothetical protein